MRLDLGEAWARMKNLTGLKSFDALDGDDRVEEVRDEGADGYWIDLAYPWDHEGCIGVHGYTVRDVLAQLRCAKRLSDADYRRIHG